MTTWNYRVVKKNVYMGKTMGSEIQFGIHETYYDGDRPTAITTDKMSPYGETLEELRSDLTRMIGALEKPVLNWEDFKDKEAEVPTDAKAISGGDRE